jgi:predicted phosphate transport protein (TIGR00153 family)
MNFFKIFGCKVDFFQLLREQSEYILKSVHALDSYVQSLNPDDAEKVKSLEKEADQKRFELVQSLDSTFITPYDREDIYMLSKSLDDILDYYKTTVKEMEIYQIGQSQELAEFIAVLTDASIDIHDAVCNMEKKPKAAVKFAVKAKKCENKVESIYRHSVAALLMGDDIKYILKMRELYRHLSNCADRIDEASDMICHILMKEIS